MLFETLNQAAVFLILFFFGILTGITNSPISFLCHKLKKKWVKFLLEFFEAILFCGEFFIINVIFNYGEIRFFTISAFILGIVIEKMAKHFVTKKLGLMLLKSKKEK